MIGKSRHDVQVDRELTDGELRRLRHALEDGIETHAILQRFAISDGRLRELARGWGLERPQRGSRARRVAPRAQEVVRG